MSENFLLLTRISAYIVATAVYAQFGRQENSSHEGEKDGQSVRSKSNYHVNALDENSGEADDENYPREDGDKHAIVNLRRSTARCVRDDVTNERCDQQCP